MKKVSFPREILALSNVGAAVVYFFVQLCGPRSSSSRPFGHAPAWHSCWILPISFLSLYFFTAALAIVMSAINVYLRDMKHLMEVLLQLWFWLTPIVYSYEHSIAPHLHAPRASVALLLESDHPHRAHVPAGLLRLDDRCTPTVVAHVPADRTSCRPGPSTDSSS